MVKWDYRRNLKEACLSAGRTRKSRRKGARRGELAVVEEEARQLLLLVRVATEVSGSMILVL